MYLFQIKNIDTRESGISSKLTVRTQERCQWRRLEIFIVNFDYVWNLALVFLLLTLDMCLFAGLDEYNWAEF